MSFSTHRPDLRRAVALGVPDAFVLDLVELGGIRRTVEFVQACEQLGFGFWFYSGDAGVATAAYLQVAAALEPIREPSQSLLRWTADDVIEGGPFSPRRGVLRVPDGPGLGVTLDRAALERCHRRFLDEGPFPSGDPARPAERYGSFGALRRF
jgi:glucarate dehydratase